MYAISGESARPEELSSSVFPLFSTAVNLPCTLILLSCCFLSESTQRAINCANVTLYLFFGNIADRHTVLRKSAILASFDPSILQKEFCNSFAPRFSSEQQRMVIITSQNLATEEAEFFYRSVRGFSWGAVSHFIGNFYL